MAKVYIIQHTYGQVYEPITYEIETAFFDYDKAVDYVSRKNKDFENLVTEHEKLYDNHVKECDLYWETEEEEICELCHWWFEKQSYIYDNHNWEVVEVEVKE